MNTEKSTAALIEKIKGDAIDHTSVPFWSWNDRLKKDELLAQIEDMKALGMNGFFMHARGGLETEYFSDEWFDAIRFCIDEAQKRGMEAWAYDENGWPSGFGGGELLKDERNHACGLECEVVSEFPEPCADTLGVYTLKGDELTRIYADQGENEYVVIRRARDFSYVDTMDPTITQQYIDYTHERYKRELGDRFGGKYMPGFFTDEPQYFRYGIPWSNHFPRTFREKYGYDILDKLPALFFKFEGSREVRYDYYYHCHESFYEGFLAPLYEWCDRNGVKLTGHGIEEWQLWGQMMCCGGIMPFYLYEHIPGIDYLGRDVKDVSGAKQLGSVCEQTGKKIRLAETFACCGWDVTPKEIKRITDLEFSGGVNRICEHLYAYSIRGQRKRDFPNFYSEHNPWHKHYALFEKHFVNLGAALAQGSEVASTLVIHPIHSAYLDFHRFERECVKELDDKFAELVERLTCDHILYHFGDELIMRKMASVEGDTIRIGECTYDKVVIPYCYTLDSSTVELLRKYLAGGGKLCLAYSAPDRIDGRVADTSFLRANMTYEELCAAQPIKLSADGAKVPMNVQVRRTEHGRIVFAANTTPNVYQNVSLTLENCTGLAELCPETLELRALRGRQDADGSCTVLLDFGDSVSFLIVETEDVPMLPFVTSEERKYIDLDPIFEFETFPENMIMLDRARVSLDGKTFSEVRPLVRIRDNLLKERYVGELTLRFEFETAAKLNNILLVAEPMKYISVTVNGHKIELDRAHGRLDRRFLGAEIAHLLTVGKNTVELCIDYYQREQVYDVLYGGGNEALRNCLTFDTEIEAAYLFGHFDVVSAGELTDEQHGDDNVIRARGDFVLDTQRKVIDLSDIVREGYAYFAGEMTAKKVLVHRAGDPTAIKLGGRFAFCCAEINGVDLGAQIFDDVLDLGDHLVEGENVLRLTLGFSNRNLLGPHNGKDPEPKFVTPLTFSFENQWNEGECAEFVDDGAFIKLGIGF